MATKKWYGWYIVFISAFIGIGMTAAYPQFTMVVTEMSIQLNTTEEFLLFSDTVKSFTIIIAMLMSGAIYNKLKLKKTFIFAMICLLVPQIIFPFLTSSFWVIPLKIMQGLSPVMFPVFILTIVDWIEQNKMGTATALFNAIFYAGAGFGATVSGFAIDLYGWKSSFFIVALMISIPAILYFFTVTRKEENNRDEATIDNGKSQRMLTKIIKLPEVWLLIGCFMSTIWIIQVLSVDLPLFGDHLGYGASTIGLLMTSLTFGIFASAMISGKASDIASLRSEVSIQGRLKVFLVGPTLTIVSIILVMISDLSNPFLFYSTILLLSFGSSWGIGSFYCMLPELLKGKTLDYSTGFIGGIADIGMSVGPLIFGVVFGVRGLWTLGWLSCILISLLSFFSCLVLIKISNKKLSS